MIEIVAGAQDLVMSSNIHIGGCPYCGGDVELIEGRLNVIDGAIEMLSGPQWSWDVVDALGMALRTAIELDIDPADAVESISPEFARSFRAATLMKSREFKRAVAETIVGLIVLDYGVAKGNVLTVMSAVQDLLHFVATNGHLPGQ